MFLRTNLRTRALLIPTEKWNIGSIGQLSIGPFYDTVETFALKDSMNGAHPTKVPNIEVGI
jgi:hypothetical protein